MAITKVDYGEVGGSVETLLWHNNAPTSQFPDQSCNLADSIRNYDEIKIVWRGGTDSSTMAHTIKVPSSEIQNTTEGRIILGNIYSSSYTYSRSVIYNSDTQLRVTNAYQIGGSGTGTSAVIPLDIYGVNN